MGNLYKKLCVFEKAENRHPLLPGASRRVILSVRLLRRQKRLAHNRMDQIGDQRSKAYIREKMIGHVNAVIPVERHEDTGDDKAAEISALTALLLVQVSTTA